MKDKSIKGLTRNHIIRMDTQRIIYVGLIFLSSEVLCCFLAIVRFTEMVFDFCSFLCPFFSLCSNKYFLLIFVLPCNCLLPCLCPSAYLFDS